jgi:hypothetical protein
MLMAITLPGGRTEVTLPDVALYPMLTEDEGHVILSGMVATEREPSTGGDVAASIVEPKSVDDIFEIEGAMPARLGVFGLAPEDVDGFLGAKQGNGARRKDRRGSRAVSRT